MEHRAGLAATVPTAFPSPTGRPSMADLDDNRPWGLATQASDFGNVSAIFDRRAAAWEGKGTVVKVVGNDSPLDGIAPLLAAPGKTVIDLGGGNGRALRKLAGQCLGGTLVLVDISRAMAEEARASLTDIGGVSTVIVVGDACRNGMQSDGADVVILRQVLQHVPDPAAVVREAVRLLKPGGVVAVQVPGANYLINWAAFSAHDADSIGRFSLSELTGLLNQPGLTTRMIATFPFTFIFDNTLDMLKFFQRISLIDKLTGYDPTVSRATELLLAQEVIAKALAQPFVFEIGGEYLLGIAQKEGMS